MWVAATWLEVSVKCQNFTVLYNDQPVDYVTDVQQPSRQR